MTDHKPCVPIRLHHEWDTTEHHHSITRLYWRNDEGEWIWRHDGDEWTDWWDYAIDPTTIMMLDEIDRLRIELRREQSITAVADGLEIPRSLIDHAAKTMDRLAELEEQQ